MKNITLLITLLLAFTFNKGQNNLIPNPGFENAKFGRSPQCDYHPNQSPEDIEKAK